jgi:WD40 repeat protein
MTEELVIYKTKLDDYVTGLQWSSTNSFFFAATAGGNVYGINPGEEQIVFQVNAHKNGVLALDTSPKENKFISGGQDGTAKLWSGTDGSLLKEIQSEQWVDLVCWSPDGNFIAISIGKSFLLIDHEGNEIARSNLHDSTIAAMAWNPDSNYLATACYGGVRVYDICKPGEFELLEWRNSLISLTWSPDGRFIMAGTQDNAIHVWQMSNPDRRDMAMHGYPNKVRAFAWDNSGKNVATNCGLDVVIWNTELETGPENTKPVVIESHKTKITVLNYQPGENMLVIGDESGQLSFWTNLNGVYHLLDNVRLNDSLAKLSWNKNGSLLVAGTSKGGVHVFEY